MKRLLSALLLLPLLPPLALFAYVSPGSPQGFVNDFGSMLTPGTAASLGADLTQFEKETGAEVAVATIPSLGGDTIENYAVKLFEEWKIGKKDADNGVLLLISREDKQMRIEVGYGLEPVITDIESAHIISDTIAPSFEKGDYDAGVTAAVVRIESDIKNGEPVTASGDNTAGLGSILSHLLYPILLGFMFLGSILGRSKSWWAGGVIGGVVGLIVGLFKGFLFTGLISMVLLIPLGLLFDFIVSRGDKSGRGPRPPWFIGGGGFGGGRGGFGGFGGGSSGGGGASGRW